MIIKKEDIIHKESVKNFLMHYLIENPRTTVNNKKLRDLFSENFSNYDLEHQLNVLYSKGIASRYAMFEFYISDDVVELIKDTLKTSRTPDWD